MATIVPINERIPLDVFEVVLSHVQHVDTLRSCALVCSSWHPLARPYLFRSVVYRPAVPGRTFKDLLAFLSTLPEPSRFLRSVTVNGLSRDGERRLELSIEEIVGQLAQLPTITYITLTALHLTRSTAVTAPSPDGTGPAPKRLAVTVLRIQECVFVRDVVPFRQLLSHFERIDALVLRHIIVEYSFRGHLMQLPPYDVQLGSVFASAVTGSSHVLGRMFEGYDAPSHSPRLSFAMALRGETSDGIAFGDIVGPVRRHVHTLSVNVLGLTCNMKWILEDQSNSPPLQDSDVTKNLPIRLFPDQYSSLETLVLYFTTTSMLRREPATLLYAGILANNWRLLTQAPARNLRHVELRFQRYGPHWRDTIDELWAIDDLEPAHIRWETVDVGILVRVPYLESFTCVLCDGGFMEQWGPIKGLPAMPRSVHSREAEFEDYVAFLKDALPRLHARGRLQFRMSDM